MASAAPPPIPPRHDDEMRGHAVKRVSFLGAERPIICQNENGPCPLIGIANVLLLRNALTLSGPSDRPEVTTAELMSLVAARILDVNDKTSNSPSSDGATSSASASAESAESAAERRERAEADELVRKNQEQNVSDAMAALPALATGLDVNVGFRHPLDFEFTPQLAIFDLLDVTLCHAWVIDPDDAQARAAVGGRSYNQLMERMIELVSAPPEPPEKSLRNGVHHANGVVWKAVSPPPPPDADADDSDPLGVNLSRLRVGHDSPPERTDDDHGGGEITAATTSGRSDASAMDATTERLVIEDFLARSASQLTPHGLRAARDRVKENELVVFFRNNHFSTVFKKDGALYLLVTDQGYLNESDVVWEALAPADDGVGGGGGGGGGGVTHAAGTFVNGRFEAFAPHLDPAEEQRRATEEDARIAAAMLASSGGGGGALGDDFLRPPPPPPPPDARGVAVGVPVGQHHRAGAGAAPQTDGDGDYALAVALQAEFEAEEAEANARRRAERRERDAEEARHRHDGTMRREREREDAAAAGGGGNAQKGAKPGKSKSGKYKKKSGSDCVLM